MKHPQRAFVTGANGFIGRAVMARLALSGIESCGVDLHADPARAVVAGDIAREGVWQRHATGCDLVFHTAAVVSNAAPAVDHRRITVEGVRHVLDAAVQAGASRFIHVSSIAAYGLDFRSERREDDVISVFSGFPYCDAKAASEHPVLAAHAAGEIEATIIRPGDVYGPGSRPWVLIPLELMRKRQFLLPMGGEGLFSPVYIENLLDGMMAAATRDTASGQIFNITDGVSVFCREFFSWHHRWLGRRGAPLSVPGLVPHRVTETVTGVADAVLNRLLKQNTEISPGSMAMLSRKAGYSIEKARRLLSYAPVIPLEDGMKRTQAWLRAARLIDQ
jgi:nucleoside-diphosphate-sugar epimerase